MKKITSLSNKTFLRIWIIFHALLFAGFLTRLCFSVFGGAGKIRMDADLFNMLPKPVASDALLKAEDKLSELTGNTMFILVSNEDFEKAKEAGAALYEKLSASPKFNEVSFYQDMSAMGDVLSFVQEKREYLLGHDAISLLEEDGGPELFMEDSLSKVYGAFTMTSLSSLDSDPFLLGESALENYLSYLQSSGTSMSLKDGVLASLVDGRWYVMIRTSLSKEGSALASKTNGVEFIYRACEGLEDGGTRFTFSGTPFHSYKASSSSSFEISLISTVSVVVVLVILLLVFRSPLPILFSFLSISLSVLSAFLASIAVFGKLHVLTLVFGTSLIGSSIDYSLHFFINWKGDPSLTDGSLVRSHLFKGLSLSLLSTVLCYFVLLFAPFELLHQISVFSIFGIVSTFLTAVCIYPLIPVPKKNRSIPILDFFAGKRESHAADSRVGDNFTDSSRTTCASPATRSIRFPHSSFAIAFVCALFAVFALILVVNRKNVGIENNLSRLYKMEGKEFQNEAEAARVLKYSPSAWFIVCGDTPEDVLVREEKVTAELRKINEGKEKGGYICTSGFVPSLVHQKRCRAAVQKLIPLAYEEFLCLGYTEDEAARLSSEYEKAFFENEDFIEIGKNVPAFLQESFSSAWIGEIDGKFYSVVLPVSVTDYEAYKSLSDGENVFLISKVQEINSDLDRLSFTVLIFFAIVYVLIFIVLKFFYSWKQCLKIVSVPLMIVVSVFAILSLFSLKLEFFSITGMILVFGLGLDYVIYMVENERRMECHAENMSMGSSENGSTTTVTNSSRLESFAIFLSFLTTLVSFGALSLSSFVPVKMIGLSIFIGLVTAYVVTFCYGLSSPRTTLVTLVLALSSLCLLSSCVSSRAAIHPVYVTNTKKFMLLPPSCMDGTKKSVQMLEGSYGNSSFSILCYLESDSEGIFISLFNEFGTGMGSLSYDGKSVSFESSVFPKNSKAEYIVSDLQFAYYSEEALSSALEKIGLTFSQTDGTDELPPNDTKVRRIMDGEKCIEKITISPKVILIENLLRNYSYILTEEEE